MGRFLSPQKRTPNAPDPLATAVSPPLAAAPTPSPAVREESVSVFHWIGMWSVCLYLISGFATEVGTRVFHASPHLAVVAMVVMFITFVLTGGLFRSMRGRISQLWWGLMLWMIICIPFSTWRTGSIMMLSNYIPRSHILLFCLAAFLISFQQCRIFMLVSAVSSYSLLLWCYLFGVMDPLAGRFVIPGSVFYQNANDLGIQLAASLGGLVYLCMQKSLVWKLLGVLGFPITLFYILKTGSRGVFLSCIAFTLVVFLYSRGVAKVLVVVGAAATLAVALLIIPSDTLSRLVLLFLNPQEAVQSEEGLTQNEVYSIGSQMARWELIKLSLWYTMTNPVFGVGPGEFVDRVDGDAARESRHSTSAGTHNTYTQVSSECGLPGAFLYIAVLWLTIRTSHRLLMQSRGHPELTELHRMAFILLITTVTFAVNALFHHLTYTGHLALLAGQALACQRAVEPLLQRLRTNPAGAG